MTLETRKAEISTTLKEIVDAERAFRERGVEIADQDEWQQLGDIVARIEQRLLGNPPADTATEAAE